MTRTTSPRLAGYLVLAALGLLLAAVLGRAELVALAAPFALFVGAAALAPRPSGLTVGFTLAGEASVEDHELDAKVELRAAQGLWRVDVVLPLPVGLESDPPLAPAALHLGRGEPRSIGFRVRAKRWGAYRIGETIVRLYDPFGLFVYDTRLEPATSLRVYPRHERVRRLVGALETQPFAGNEVARTKGEGIEFADIRPFALGDRVRRINWRASAKRQELYVNESHPERNTDIVLFLDAFSDVGTELDNTLERGVRAAATLARAYLERRDRVGLVSFSGVLRWLTPALGHRQIYQLLDTLLETRIVPTYVWRGIELVPPRTLPPNALVIALTPLLDERSVHALLDLRARGFDLVIVEISPLPYVPAGRGELDRLAYRLWALWRDALRFRYERLGVPVVEWREGAPLAQAVEEVIAFRRSARLARVR